MIARFLLGPAGSGKTWRCREEVRAALQESPAGAPLVWVAPKQATFQLERQLLSEPDLPGYTRLEILSFERLAGRVLERFGVATPRCLAESGRLMVLRALLAQRHGGLDVFRGSARLPGFAGELDRVLRELRQHGIGVARLRRAADGRLTAPALAGKLADLAGMLEAYEAWLAGHGLRDDPALLEEAVAVLRRQPEVGGESAPLFGRLWLDGFAEMTPQELDLLAAVVPRCGGATLGFCLEAAPAVPPDWMSMWGLVGRSFQALHDRLAGVSGVEIVQEELPRDPDRGRFRDQPALAQVEAHWHDPEPLGARADGAVEVVACRDPEAEVIAAARAIRRFVATGGRYREAAVIVRALDRYEPLVESVFARYEIPCFLDCRLSIAHHPLAELTRSALRLAALGWRNEDWFAALKTGLLPAGEEDVDALENEALARGWEGRVWWRPIECDDDPVAGRRFERLRRRLIPPFIRLARDLGGPAPLNDPADTGSGNGPGEPAVDGSQLAAAVHALWKRLRVDRVLDGWSEAALARGGEGPGGSRTPPHSGVLEPMLDWLRNVALAFAGTAQPLRAWLPILETGLARLTVGAIPPALDQVLVGAIDRSRNPALRLAVVLGLNEGVFPAVPTPARLLTDSDREELALQGIELSPDRQWQIGRERYYGYIACTRASERLILTFSRQDASGTAIPPSPLISHLQQLLPDLASGVGRETSDWTDSVHPTELTAAVLRLARAEAEPAPSGLSCAEPLLTHPAFAGLRPLVTQVQDAGAAIGLHWELARALYGPGDPRLSASALERFAACPFQCFVHVGLRAAERRRFEADPRQLGSFAHHLLARFHARVREGGGHWRDLTPAGARELLEALAAGILDSFGYGVLRAAAQSRFAVRSAVRHLADYVGTMIGWLQTSYQLDPVAAELRFGGKEAPLPAWQLPLGDGQTVLMVGQIDRVDLAREPSAGGRLAVIVDYKTTARRLDPLLLEHGIQIQLPVYLRALESLVPQSAALGTEPIEPAGMFYVGLRPDVRPAKGRRAAWDEAETIRQRGWQHRGRFALDHLDRLDATAAGTPPSGQFSLPKSRRLQGNYSDPISAADLESLLERTEAVVVRLARRLLSGEIRVDPFRKGTGTACARCEYAGICRIDPWTHPFRRLDAATAGRAGEEETVAQRKAD